MGLAMDQPALPSWREAGDCEQEAFIFATLGTTHARIGDKEECERFHAQSLRVAREESRAAGRHVSEPGERSAAAR